MPFRCGRPGGAGISRSGTPAMAWASVARCPEHRPQGVLIEQGGNGFFGLSTSRACVRPRPSKGSSARRNCRPHERTAAVSGSRPRRISATDCRGCGNFQPDRHGGRGAWRPPLQSDAGRCRRKAVPSSPNSSRGRFRAMPARGAARRASAPHSRAEAVWRLRAHRVRAAGLAQGGGWLRRQAGLRVRAIPRSTGLAGLHIEEGGA